MANVGRERRRELRPVPPEQVDAVEAPQRLEILDPLPVEISPQDLRPEKLLEADSSPDPVKKAEPRKAENCGHCGKPLSTLRSAASRYCDRYCAKAARKARATELPIYSPAATTSTRARFQGLQPDAVPKKERDVG
jgi:hypothetical protein